MNKFYSFLFLTILILINACQGGDKADAYGNFEAIETIVSAQVSGELKAFRIEEGMIIAPGQVLGYIDTLQLYLQKKQLRANIKAILAKAPDITVQLNVLEEQLSTALREQQRIKSLLKSEAATSKQADDINSQVEYIRRQLKALQSNLSTQTRALLAEVETLKIQIERLNDQLLKSIIKNPIRGTVLNKYIETFELVTIGKPLYKIANLDDMIMKAYISGEQLSQIKLNDQVDVSIDLLHGKMKTYTGVITWVSDKSEFTPKIVQTKDERVNLVYAMKIRVKNDGGIKIGMPGEVRFRVLVK